MFLVVIDLFLIYFIYVFVNFMMPSIVSWDVWIVVFGVVVYFQEVAIWGAIMYFGCYTAHSQVGPDMIVIFFPWF